MRPHSTSRAKLDPEVKLPRHGLVLRGWSLHAELTVTIDADAKTLHAHAISMNQPDDDRSRTLTDDELSRLMAAGNAAWDETPTGPMPHATDLREDLYVADGEQVFYLTGRPISALGMPTGRPAASNAVAAITAAAHR